MEVEKIPVTFKFGGIAYSVEGNRFKPDRETMVRFAVNLPRRKHPNIIVLYEVNKPGQKYRWECRSVPENEDLSKIIAKALEKEDTAKKNLKVAAKRTVAKKTNSPINFFYVRYLG